MTHEERLRSDDDAKIAEVLHIIVERELNGEEAIDMCWAKSYDMLKKAERKVIKEKLNERN